MEEKKEGAKPYPFLHPLLLSHLWGGWEVGREKLGIRGFFSSSKAQAHNLMSKKKILLPNWKHNIGPRTKVILKLFISLKTNNNNQKIPNKQKSRHDGRNIRVSVIQGDCSIYSNCCGQTKQIPRHTRATLHPRPAPHRPLPTPTDTLENNSTQAH